MSTLLEAALAAYERLNWFRGVRRRTVTTATGPVSYLESGSGPKPSLVLVHGLGSSSISWIRALPPLAKFAHAIAPDLPGFGRTPLPGGRDFCDRAQLVASLRAFLDGEQVPSGVVLVGQSLGGWVALGCLDHPKVSALILMDSAGTYYEGIEELKTLLRPVGRRAVFSFWAKLWHRTPWVIRPFWRGASRRMNTSRVIGFLDSVRRSDFLEAPPARSIPTLIIWGQQDAVLPPANVESFLQLFPHAHVHWISQCGHMPAVEQPARFAAAVKGFLASVRPVQA